jgi:hypothetical protein
MLHHRFPHENSSILRCFHIWTQSSSSSSALGGAMASWPVRYFDATSFGASHGLWIVSGKIHLVDPKSTLWSSPVAILAEIPTILVDQESPCLLPNSCVSTCYMVCWWNTHGLLKPMVNWLNPIENIRQIPTVKNHFGCSAPHVKRGRPTGPQLAMKQHWSTWPLKNNIYITHSMPWNSTESHSIQSYFHQDPMKSYQNHIQSNYNPMKSQNLMKSHSVNPFNRPGRELTLASAMVGSAMTGTSGSGAGASTCLGPRKWASNFRVFLKFS